MKFKHTLPSYKW